MQTRSRLAEILGIIGGFGNGNNSEILIIINPSHTVIPVLRKWVE